MSLWHVVNPQVKPERLVPTGRAAWDPDTGCGCCGSREDSGGLFAPALEAFVLAGGALDWKAVALLRINTILKKDLFNSIMNSVPFKCDSG